MGLIRLLASGKMRSLSERVIKPSWAERGLYYALAMATIASFGFLGFRCLWRLLSGTNPSVNLVLCFALLAGAIGCPWLLLRTAHSTLIVRDREIEVRNPFRSTVIARANLRRIVASSGGNWIMAETTSGQRTAIVAISSGFIWTTSKRAARWNQDLGLRP